MMLSKKFALEPVGSQDMSSCSRYMKKYWSDWLLINILLVPLCILHFVTEPKRRVFFENDPVLSYPLVPEESVPQYALFLYSLLIPIVGIYFMVYLLGRSSSDNVAVCILRPFVFIVESFGLNLIITLLLKKFCGRQRPNFFALCDYKGYRNAISGDAEAMKNYLNTTTFGAIGDWKYCRASMKDINEAFYSFPSGHSSIIFQGMVCLSIFYYGALDMNQKSRFLIAIMIGIPIVAASLVAETRTRDFYHHYADVVGGAVIGTFCSVLMYLIHYPGPQIANVTY